MSEEKVNVQIDINTEWIFLSVLLVLFVVFAGKGCHGEPSNYEHFLKAAYDYKMEDFSK